MIYDWYMNNKKIHVLRDTWRVTHNTSHVTHDMLWEVNIVPKFKLSSSDGLGVIMFRRLGGKGWLTDWTNYGFEGLSRRATATPSVNISDSLHAQHELVSTWDIRSPPPWGRSHRSPGPARPSSQPATKHLCICNNETLPGNLKEVKGLLLHAYHSRDTQISSKGFWTLGFLQSKWDYLENWPLNKLFFDLVEYTDFLLYLLIGIKNVHAFSRPGRSQGVLYKHLRY